MPRASADRYGLGGPHEACEPPHPSNPLKAVFDRWWSDKDRTYESAMSLLAAADLRPDPEDAEALVAAHSDLPGLEPYLGGSFLSACYNRSDAQVIIYHGCGDLSLSIGKGLPHGKTLVVAGAADGVSHTKGGTVLVAGEAKMVGIECHESALILTGRTERVAPDSSVVLIDVPFQGEYRHVDHRNGYEMPAHIQLFSKDYVSFQIRDPRQTRDWTPGTVGGSEPCSFHPYVFPYLHRIADPFLPGTPLKRQIAAARKIDGRKMRQTIIRLLHKEEELP